MKFKVYDLKMIVNDDSSDYTIVLDRTIEVNRWSTTQECVFKDNKTGELFVTDYRRDTTEMGGDGPFEYYKNEDMIECKSVKLTTAEIEVYMYENGTYIPK
jgi:hypothetical protein